MVSFIVIGRNEGLVLNQCFLSIRKAISRCGLSAEVIYVDSKSTDNSVAIAKAFKEVRVFTITGRYNSAIARNIGAKEARGEVLFFLDGDMELDPAFPGIVLLDGCHLKYDFVSGNFINHYYNQSGEIVKKDFYRKIYCSEDTFQSTTGGLFAITKKRWDEMGGMQPKFKKGQDLDLGYRLAKSGCLLLRKKEVMAIHHTVDYKASTRLWSSFLTGAYVYPRAVLYRSNWRNKYVWRRMLTSDPTLLLFGASALLIVPFGFLPASVLYLVGVVAGVMHSMGWKLKSNSLERIVNQIARDLVNVIAFFLFFPSNRVIYAYEEV